MGQLDVWVLSESNRWELFVNIALKNLIVSDQFDARHCHTCQHIIEMLIKCLVLNILIRQGVLLVT